MIFSICAYGYLWGTDDFAFYRSLHVASIERVKLDESLLVALQAADSKDQLPHAAIVEFNLANTDSSDVPQHTEVVMTKSAFEHPFEMVVLATDFARPSALPAPQ